MGLKGPSVTKLEEAQQVRKPRLQDGKWVAPGHTVSAGPEPAQK